MQNATAKANLDDDKNLQSSENSQDITTLAIFAFSCAEMQGTNSEREGLD